MRHPAKEDVMKASLCRLCWFPKGLCLYCIRVFFQVCFETLLFSGIQFRHRVKAANRGIGVMMFISGAIILNTKVENAPGRYRRRLSHELVLCTNFNEHIQQIASPGKYARTYRKRVGSIFHAYFHKIYTGYNSGNTHFR